MDAYVYQAALLCEDCAFRTREHIAARRPELVPADPEDEATYDSAHYPKGPHSNGGGAADSPQYCDNCHAFLENPLTDDGIRNTLEEIGKALVRAAEGKGFPAAARDWLGYFDTVEDLIRAASDQ